MSSSHLVMLAIAAAAFGGTILAHAVMKLAGVG